MADVSLVNVLNAFGDTASRFLQRWHLLRLARGGRICLEKYCYRNIVIGRQRYGELFNDISTNASNPIACRWNWIAWDNMVFTDFDDSWVRRWYDICFRQQRHLRRVSGWCVALLDRQAWFPRQKLSAAFVHQSVEAGKEPRTRISITLRLTE